MARMRPAEHSNLAWMTKDTLTDLGYRRDEIGRIRKGDLFVCGISGRFHDQYLRPWPDYDHTRGLTVPIFIDDESIRQFCRDIIASVRELAGSTASVFVELLFSGALSMMWRFIRSKVGF